MAPTIKDFGGRYRRLSEASAANTALELTTPTGVPVRISRVTVRYSPTPTHTGVTTDTLLGLGTSYNVRLNSGAANATDTIYIPTELLLAADDAIIVTAPAGGAGKTSQISVYIELL